MKIDRKDKRILNILLKNSRLSNREIARKTGLSTATVISRIKKLEREKIIKKYSVSLDYEKIGYGIEALIEILVLKGKSPLIKKKILSSQNVYAVFEITGEYDIAVLARFKDKTELNDFLDNLQSHEFIQRTNTKVILKSEESGAGII